MKNTDNVTCSTLFSSAFAWRVEATCRARAWQDADSDLIADDWELQHFGGGACDPDGDEDNDGRSNLEEFIAGTDPTNKLSILAISEIQKDAWGESTVLSWESVPGRKYQVLYCDNLEDKDWHCLGREILGTDNGTMLIWDNVLLHPGMVRGPHRE
jgi:hypothetical protein